MNLGIALRKTLFRNLLVTPNEAMSLSKHLTGCFAPLSMTAWVVLLVACATPPSETAAPTSVV